VNREKFEEPLREAGLGDYAEAILRYAKPCIRLHAQSVDDHNSLPLGASRIGGLPDLPIGAKWLTRNGRFCEFIAQINLTEASQYDETGLLPKEGFLLFFFDGRDYEDADYQPIQRGSETIIYYTGALASLERAIAFPSSLEEWQRYRPCSIRFEKDWILPPWGSVATIALEIELFGRTSVFDPETPLANAYSEATYKLMPFLDGDKHHMFGYPEPVIQDDPVYSIPGVWDDREIDEELASQWLLLLQISSDNAAEMMWADTSSIYYCIHKDDLIARQFQNALCIGQSH
jgi:hypothetical protein